MRFAIPALFLSLALTGCAIGPTASPSSQQGLVLQGEVHGGQQPIAQAHVYMFAANTTGYGGPGIAPSSSNASVSVFTAAATGQSDSVGPYILTSSTGNFTFPTYTCIPNTQVYLYVLGGNPGDGTNTSSALLAALGNCPTADNFNTSVPYISINEITTVAAAYALAGFASDATHVSSSGSALAKTGIANAFANAGNLANVATGAALATTPGGNGTVPHDEIITLADILASCINSNGAVTNNPTATNCYTLFTNTLAFSTGTQPSDTATAAINIAQNPSSNVGNLFSLAAAKSPYTTTSNYSQPADWSIGITFTGGGLVGPTAVAIDGTGNAWAINGYTNNVTELSNLGAALSQSTGYTGGGLSYPSAIAIDSSGNAWIANSGATSVSKFSPTGAAISSSAGYTGGGVFTPTGIAIDGLGNVWTSNVVSISKLNSSGTAISSSSGYRGGGLNTPSAIAFDGDGNAWITNSGNSSVSKFSSAGTAITSSAGYTGGNMNDPVALAINSSGDVWVPSANSDSFTELSNSGAILSPSTGFYRGQSFNGPIALDGAGNEWIARSGYIEGFSSTPTYLGILAVNGGATTTYGVAVDGSGDIWVAGNNNSTLVELIGAATPVITPICAGLPATPIANGSSNLGARPLIAVLSIPSTKFGDPFIATLR